MYSGIKFIDDRTEHRHTHETQKEILLTTQLTQNVPRTFALGDVFVRTLGTFSEHSANVTVERTKPTFKQRCIQRLANVI